MMKIKYKKQMKIWEKNRKQGIVFFRPYDKPTPRTELEVIRGNHFAFIKKMLCL